MRATAPKKPKLPEPFPGVDVGDEVFFHHAAGPRAGKVVCHGKHGVTLDCDGQQHKARWEHVLGHKKRATQRYTVLDEGEDGMIVQDAAGNRRFLAVPPESREDRMIAKSGAAGHRLLLFVKADEPGKPMANRPGLTRKEITDRTGRRQTKWVRTDKDQPTKRNPAAKDAEAGAAAGYGTHNLQAGDKVQFKAGDFEGAGVIVGKPGNDGAHVKDASGRLHQVRWSEITGHDKNGASKPGFETEVRGEQKQIPADRFVATDYAKQHDKADVTPEEILSHFPPDTMDKIRDVQQRLASVEQTIDQHKQGNEYNRDRLQLHRRIIFEGVHVKDQDGKTVFKPGLLAPERVAAATPADGEQPTFTILGGRGGSGKSWFKRKVYDPDKAIVLDADEIKSMMPEYEGWNAHQVHEESSDILDAVIAMARKRGLNVVLDATMKTSKSALKKIEAFKKDGYRIEAHYMHLPRQEAAKRAVSRFLGKTNRYVPVDVVLGNTTNEATFDEVRRHADKWSFRDNNVQQGQEPILISESGVNDVAEQPKSAAENDVAPLRKSECAPIIVLWRSS